MFGISRAKNNVDSHFEDPKSEKVQFFVVSMVNGDTFDVFNSCKFANGVYVDSVGSNLYSVDNNDLCDVKNGVVRHDDLISYDRAIKLVEPSGKSYTQINPKHISSVSGFCVVDVDSSKLLRRD